MRFSCERCGKKYATADPPSPGKIYKMKCKACGHLIVLRATASAAAQPGAPGAAASPAPSLEIPDLAAPPDVAAPVRNGAPAGSPQAAGEATSQIDIDAAAPAEEAAQPQQGDSGYVDLFSDLTPMKGLEVAAQDPLFAAARASLPEAYGSAGGAPDPFAALAGRAGAPVRQPSSIPQIPAIPKPPPHRNGLYIGLIGGGVAVLVGILAFVLLGFGRKTVPPPRPVRAESPVLPAPPPLPPPEPVQAQAPDPSPPPVEAQPRATAPKPAPGPSSGQGGEERRREERRRRVREDAQAARDGQERQQRAQEERDAKERERRERDAADRERKDRERLTAAAAQQESDTLTQAQIESVLRSTKKAFDQCLATARSTDPRLDGRRVLLRLNIQPSGTVTYPTFDDVTLNGTDVGSCLKSAARLMVFPKFKGDTLHVEVPIVMR